MYYVHTFLSKIIDFFVVIGEKMVEIHSVHKYPVNGQLISKCPPGVFKSSKKNNELFLRMSALASKKRSNQKDKVTLYHQIEDFILTLLHNFFDLTSF